MNSELRKLLEARLNAEGRADTVMATVVLAACTGRESLNALLDGGAFGDEADIAPQPDSLTTEAYLTSLTVRAFRGIGAEQRLDFDAGPGLTLVIGRNGSGKSSFAEALEVLFTGDSRRWAERPKIWKEGWRNLHVTHPTAISAELLLAGDGPAKIEATWSQDAALEDVETFVQPRGKPRTTVEKLGWNEALVSFRPFLSYNELGSLLDDGPSKLYDALSLVLGLEELVDAQQALTKARTERQKLYKEADQQRKQFLAILDELRRRGNDERALACSVALKSQDWGLDGLDGVLAGSTVVGEDSTVGALQQIASLATVDATRARKLVEDLREAEAALENIAGTDSERSRELAGLLQNALEFHEGHEGTDCPVCGTSAKLGPEWADVTRRNIAELRSRAAESERIHAKAKAVRSQAIDLLRVPVPRALHMEKVDVDGVDTALKAWSVWNNGAQLIQLSQLADHIDAHHASFAEAVDRVKSAAGNELQKRQDLWRPVAVQLGTWSASARKARSGEEFVGIIGEAEEWLKKAAGKIRDERFSPIADAAMSIWDLLRQNSNVELGRIELTGTGTKRSVSLDVTVDGVAGAALGVMSQGELHSLALSLFLPRATLTESPFRFVVIDDPVQSMDPARVDGLARVLEKVATTRQVIVFTHDDRLPEAVRRLRINAKHFAVTRRPGSVVEVRKALDPVSAAVDDALALVHTADLPREVLQRVVPGYCRSALEAACQQVVRRRRLGKGQLHAEVERELEGATKLNTLASLALFDDATRGGDVLPRLNKMGGWAGDAFVAVKDGAHAGYAGDMRHLVENIERLCEEIIELK